MLDRLASGDVDYSAWRCRKWFGRSEYIQEHALQEVDQHTIRGLLRDSPGFTRLDQQRQKSLLTSMNAANWRDAQAGLSKEQGEQLSFVAVHGIPRPTSAIPKIKLNNTPKPPAS